MQADRARELLSRERKRIERALGNAGHVDNGDLSDDNGGEHLADHATDLYDAEYEEGLSEQHRKELAALERAESRLAQGSYGVSIESGEPIPDERLEANPLAERTIAEQERYER